MNVCLPNVQILNKVKRTKRKPKIYLFSVKLYLFHFLLTKQLRHTGVNVKHVVTEQRWVFRLAVVLHEHPVQELLVLQRLLRTFGQTSAHIHHQLIWKKLQTINSCRQPVICPITNRKNTIIQIEDSFSSQMLCNRCEMVHKLK